MRTVGVSRSLAGRSSGFRAWDLSTSTRRNNDPSSLIALKATRLQFEAVLDSLFSAASEEFVTSAISREEGVMLQQLASLPEVRKTIEVGFANGVSGLYICAGLANKKDVSHTAIDPFQISEYKGRGVENLRRTGFDSFQLIPQPSEIALPALLSKGECYDMALIDGLHTADQTLVDFYFLDRLIRVGGIIVFDDVHSPAVSKIARYVATYPNYSVLSICGRRGWRRRVINSLKVVACVALSPMRHLVGEAICREFFDTSLLHRDWLRSIDSCTMVAFRKTANYQRDTNWYMGI